MHSVHLSHYVIDPETAALHRVLWTAIRNRLPVAVRRDLPRNVEPPHLHGRAAQEASVALGQVCGVVAAQLDADVLATPSFVGSQKGAYRSHLVGRRGGYVGPDPVVAVNQLDSHSGFGALCSLLHQPPNRVVVTGAHVDSMRAVQDGAADVAAIDCVTYDLVARYRSELAHGLQILRTSRSAPAPPLISRADADTQAHLRAALLSLHTTHAPLLQALGVERFIAPRTDYHTLLGWESTARRLLPSASCTPVGS